MKKQYNKIFRWMLVLCLMISAVIFTGCGQNENKKDTELSGTGENDTGETDTEETDTEEINTEEDRTPAEENQESDTVPETESSSEAVTEDNASSETENSSESNTGSATGTNSESNTGSSTEADAPESSEKGFQTGTYRGGHKVQAMGAELPYTYTMQFHDDGTYSYQVSFVVGGETYSEEETGTYSVNGNAISFTSSDGTSMSGSYSEHVVTVTRMVSSFASEEAEITLRQ